MRQFRGGEHLRRVIRAETGKAPFGRVIVEGAGGLAVVKIHTCRPDRVQSGRTDDLISELERALNATVTVEIVPEAHAIAKMVRVPPNKARRVINAIRGKSVPEAWALLQFTPNRVAEPLAKLLRSAVANAEEGWGADAASLKISEVKADAGPSFKRIRPRAQGRVYRILRRTSHLTLYVQEGEPQPQRAGRRRGAAVVTTA